MLKQILIRSIHRLKLKIKKKSIKKKSVNKERDQIYPLW